MRFTVGLRRWLLGSLLIITACRPLPASPPPATGSVAAAATREVTLTHPATTIPRVTSTDTVSPPTPPASPAATPTSTPPSAAAVPFLAFEVTAGEVIALTGAAVIDGTGAPAQANSTVLIQADRILDVGTELSIPAGARVVDLTGQTIIPGLFDLHAHLYTNNGRGFVGDFLAYPRLYLAGGVTTLFTAGDVEPIGALQLRDQIERGEAVGPHVLAAGPYFDGPGAAGWMESASTAAELRAAFMGWRSRIDSLKVYTHITEPQLAALIEAAHANGLRVTGHLASVPAGRAIALGLDGLEHGLFSMSEFFSAAAHYTAQYCALAELDMGSPEVAAVVDAIVAKQVYVDPTLVVFAPELSGFEPYPADWDQYVTPLALPNVLRFQRSLQLGDDTCLRRALANQRVLIRTLHERGGLVVTGTDAVLPVIPPGYALHRELANLVEAGLTPLDAIRAGSLDAATALGLAADRGTIAPGQRADLIVLASDPTHDISAVGTTQIVFKDGLPYDPAALRASVQGLIGIP